MENNKSKNPSLEEALKWYDKFEKEVVVFGNKSENNDFNTFKPYRNNTVLEDGVYVTMRCGLTGIYTCLNWIKDGKWSTEVLDDSITIAYRQLTDKERNEAKRYNAENILTI